MTTSIAADMSAKYFNGSWKNIHKTSGDCSCNSCIDIQFDKPEDSSCVASNQIFLNARYEYDKKNRLITDLNTMTTSWLDNMLIIQANNEIRRKMDVWKSDSLYVYIK